MKLLLSLLRDAIGDSGHHQMFALAYGVLQNTQSFYNSLEPEGAKVKTTFNTTFTDELCAQM